MEKDLGRFLGLKCTLGLAVATYTPPHPIKFNYNFTRNLSPEGPSSSKTILKISDLMMGERLGERERRKKEETGEREREEEERDERGEREERDERGER